MIRIAFAAALVLLAACGGSRAPKAEAPQPTQVTEMRTIESVDPRPVVIDPPPVLQDEAAPPKPLGQPWETPQPVVLTPEDEKLRASLPFTPAIAMDPVAGSKISMTASTPTFEYKGRIYYFESEANKRLFMVNPAQFLTGKFTRL
jgi:YHS domain-containing protein